MAEAAINESTVPKMPASSYVQNNKIKFAELVRHAWLSTNGIRFFLIGCMILIISIPLAVDIIISLMLPGKGLITTVIHFSLSILMTIFLSYPLNLGFIMMAIDRSRGLPISIKRIFSFFKPRIFLETFKLLIGCLLIIGGLLCLVFGLSHSLGFNLTTYVLTKSAGLFVVLSAILVLYFSLLYVFALPLIGDKNLTAGKALLVSFKGINRYAGIVLTILFSLIIVILFAVLLFVFVIPIATKMIVGVICGSLAFFYVMPFFPLLFAGLYNRIFQSAVII